MKKKMLYTVLIVIFIGIVGPPSFAEMGSQSFVVPTSIFSNGGLSSNSDSYEMLTTLGQSTPVGEQNSPSYSNFTGYWYTTEADISFDVCECDVSGDGNITPQDALCAFQKYLMICPTLCGTCEEVCCDVNRDNNCTPGDALCIFQEYLGIGCEYCD